MLKAVVSEYLDAINSFEALTRRLGAFFLHVALLLIILGKDSFV